MPWAHVDIAGTASDTGKAYARKGGTGFGVRMIVELADSLAASDDPAMRATAHDAQPWSSSTT